MNSPVYLKLDNFLAWKGVHPNPPPFGPGSVKEYMLGEYAHMSPVVPDMQLSHLRKLLASVFVEDKVIWQATKDTVCSLVYVVYLRQLSMLSVCQRNYLAAKTL